MTNLIVSSVRSGTFPTIMSVRRIQVAACKRRSSLSVDEYSMVQMSVYQIYTSAASVPLRDGTAHVEPVEGVLGTRAWQLCGMYLSTRRRSRGPTGQTPAPPSPPVLGISIYHLPIRFPSGISVLRVKLSASTHIGWLLLSRVRLLMAQVPGALGGLRLGDHGALHEVGLSGEQALAKELEGEQAFTTS